MCKLRFIRIVKRISSDFLNRDIVSYITIRLENHILCSRERVNFFNEKDEIKFFKSFSCQNNLMDFEILIEVSKEDESLSIMLKNYLALKKDINYDIKLIFHTCNVNILFSSTLLSLHSRYFERMLQSNMIENRLKKINIHDITLETFQSIIFYIMFGYIKVNNFDEFLEIFIVADNYLFDDLLKTCSERLRDNLNADNVVKCLLVCENRSCNELINDCLKYIARNLKKVKESDDFKNYSHLLNTKI